MTDAEIRAKYGLDDSSVSSEVEPEVLTDAQIRAKYQLDGPKQRPEEYQYTVPASSLLGVSDALSFGMIPEVGGAMKSPMGALKKIGAMFARGGTGVGDPNDPDIKKYLREKKFYEKELGHAEEDNPIAFGTANITGQLAQAAFAAPAGLTGMALTQAAQGAGQSEADTASGIASDAVVRGAMGLGGGMIGKGMGSLAGYLGRIKPETTANVLSQAARLVPGGSRVQPMVRDYLLKKLAPKAAEKAPEGLGFLGSGGLLGTPPPPPAPPPSTMQQIGSVGSKFIGNMVKPQTVGTAAAGAGGGSARDFFKQYYGSLKFRESQP